ncbi:MAG: hypothetical protein ACFFBP_11180 [Promethearchaeota archaeon]
MSEKTKEIQKLKEEISNIKEENETIRENLGDVTKLQMDILAFKKYQEIINLEWNKFMESRKKEESD